MLTRAEENYLKTIFHLEHDSKGEVATNAIAATMETKASSVTDMIQKMADKELVLYKKYKGVQLTDEGRKMAANVVRKHRLWEVFLVDKLHFQWDEVHDIAEQLEHIRSDELVNRLDDFLGNPTTDPHGDPIPDAEGRFKKTPKTLLSKLDPGQTAVCVGVKESGTEFLQYLDKRKINIGTPIEVIEKEDFDGSMLIKVRQDAFSISQTIAENLFVNPTVSKNK